MKSCVNTRSLLFTAGQDVHALSLKIRAEFCQKMCTLKQNSIRILPITPFKLKLETVRLIFKMYLPLAIKSRSIGVSC